MDDLARGVAWFGVTLLGLLLAAALIDNWDADR